MEQPENRIKEIENEKSKDQDQELEKLNIRVNTMEQNKMINLTQEHLNLTPLKLLKKSRSKK